MAIFQSPKRSFEARNLQENRSNSADGAILADFQAPKFEISDPIIASPYPSLSIPPLDPLLPALFCISHDLDSVPGRLDHDPSTAQYSDSL